MATGGTGAGGQPSGGGGADSWGTASGAANGGQGPGSGGLELTGGSGGLPNGGAAPSGGRADLPAGGVSQGGGGTDASLLEVTLQRRAAGSLCIYGSQIVAAKIVGARSGSGGLVASGVFHSGWNPRFPGCETADCEVTDSLDPIRLSPAKEAKFRSLVAALPTGSCVMTPEPACSSCLTSVLTVDGAEFVEDRCMSELCTGYLAAVRALEAFFDQLERLSRDPCAGGIEVQAQGSPTNPCQYSIPYPAHGYFVDPGSLELAQSAENQTPTMLTQASGSLCSDGQWYVSQADGLGVPAEVALCPAACEAVSSEFTRRIDALFTCLTA